MCHTNRLSMLFSINVTNFASSADVRLALTLHETIHHNSNANRKAVTLSKLNVIPAWKTLTLAITF